MVNRKGAFVFIQVVHTFCVVASLCACFPASAALVEEVIDMPIEVRNRFGLEARQTMKVGILRDGAITTRQPFLILGHGRPANGVQRCDE